MEQIVKIKKLKNYGDFPLPAYETIGSAGMDLRSASMHDINILAGQIKLVPTGIAIALSKNMEAQIRPRSGLAVKHGISIVNSPGTIDSDYRGEIKVIIINMGKDAFCIKAGMRIAQMVFAPVLRVSLQEVSFLDETQRKHKGFGSTGL